MSQSSYDRDLDRNAANFQPLTPLTYLERAAAVFPDRLAIAHGPLRRPDEKWGETPCAFVEMKPGHTASADELIEWRRARLARYKCPRTIVFAEIPKASTGKVQKFVLGERAKTLGQNAA